MSFSGLSGQYGNIPHSIFKEKYEVTNINEPIMQSDNFIRNVLRDMSCSKPFLESDQKREDCHSEEFINLRIGGHRSNETPDAPDLFLELTGKDRRGTQNVPIFRDAAAATWEKRDMHIFRDDDDRTVMESQKHPNVVIQQLKDQFYSLKDRMKWFSTSKDSQLDRSSQQQQSNASKVDHSSSSYSSRKERMTVAPKQHYANISNITPIGWEQTSDHEFKVASYGQVRQTGALGDSEENRRDISNDSKMGWYNDQWVSANIAKMMKHTLDDKMQNGEWRPSLEINTTNSQYSLLGEQQSKASKTNDDQSFHDGQLNVERFLGQLNRQSGMAGQDIETQLNIINFMDQSIRSSNKDSAAFNASEIVSSLKRQNEYFASGNTSRNYKTDQVRNTDVDNKSYDSVQVARLGRSKLTQYGDKLSLTLRGENYKTQSKTMDNEKHPDQVKLRNPYSSHKTQSVQDFTIKDSFRGKMGNKFMRDKMERDEKLNDISELS